MAVGAQDIGSDVGVARIGLAERSSVARPCSLERVGMDGRDGEASFSKDVDDQPGGALDEDGELVARTEAIEAVDQVGEPLAGMTNGEGGTDLTGGIDDADIVLVAGPVDAAEVMGRKSLHEILPAEVSTSAPA